MAKKTKTASNNPIDVNSKRLAKIDKEFGDCKQFNLERIRAEMNILTPQLAEIIIQMGRRFILLKEHLSFGEFLEEVALLGHTPRIAQQCMQAAYKFSGNRASLASLGKSKMIELMGEDDEKLEALAKGGTIFGDKTVDDLEKMSVREVRQSCRKKDDEITAQSKIIANKDKKINDLYKKTLKSRPWPDRVHEINAEISGYASKLIASTDLMEKMRDVIMREEFDGDVADEAVESMCIKHFCEVENIAQHVAQLIHNTNETFSGYTDRRIGDL